MACDKACMLVTCLPPSNRAFLLPQADVLELLKHRQPLSRHSPLYLSVCAVSHRWLKLASSPCCCLPNPCPARLHCHRVFRHPSQLCRNCERIQELRLLPHLPGCKFACQNVRQAPWSCHRPSGARCALLEPEGEALLSSQPCLPRLWHVLGPVLNRFRSLTWR